MVPVYYGARLCATHNLHAQHGNVVSQLQKTGVLHGVEMFLTELNPDASRTEVATYQNLAIIGVINLYVPNDVIKIIVGISSIHFQPTIQGLS